LANEDSVARGAIGKGVYGKLTTQDLATLLPDIVNAVRKLAPSDEMFGDGVRFNGLDLLSKHHIAEGMPLCVEIIEPDRWGCGARLGKCLEYLRRYGGNARELVPALQKVRAQVFKGSPKNAIMITVKEMGTVGDGKTPCTDVIQKAYALVVGVDVRNIRIEGVGCIDGQGTLLAKRTADTTPGRFSSASYGARTFPS